MLNAPGFVLKNTKRSRNYYVKNVTCGVVKYCKNLYDAYIFGDYERAVDYLVRHDCSGDFAIVHYVSVPRIINETIIDEIYIERRKLVEKLRTKNRQYWYGNKELPDTPFKAMKRCIEAGAFEKYDYAIYYGRMSKDRWKKVLSYFGSNTDFHDEKPVLLINKNNFMVVPFLQILANKNDILRVVKIKDIIKKDLDKVNFYDYG